MKETAPVERRETLVLAHSTSYLDRDGDERDVEEDDDGAERDTDDDDDGADLETVGADRL